MKKIMTLAAVAVFVSTGCATILNDDVQRINVSSSNNQPIEGSINGQSFSGPGIVEVTRAREDKVLRVDTEGCRKESLVASSVDPVFFINILSGGVFGSSTDYSTDRMWKYDDNVVVPC